MSTEVASAMLAQFDRNMERVTSEGVNAAGGGFRASRYRLRPEKEPDSASEGLYFLDMPETPSKDSHFGTGINIWNGVVILQLGFLRPGGDAGGGDRRSVLALAADDCMKVGDVLENPDNYNSAASGLRIVVYKGGRRAFDLDRFEVWEIRFEVQWQSLVIRS